MAKLQRKLASLIEVRSALLEYESLPDLINAALVFARNKLNTQTASVFLFSKDGFLERVGIQGINKHGNPISPNWFTYERHKVGDSFTGKVVLARGKSKYGEPLWSNHLQDEDLNDRSKSKYLEEIGHLNSAIAVPLNGQHRTFGVLEVINKLPREGKNKNQYTDFSSDDVYWLSNIGNNLATAISTLRRRNELRTLAKISQWLVEPFSGYIDANKIYNEIAQELTNSFVSYKACIIRIEKPKGILSISGYAGDNIHWEGLTDESIEEGTGIAWKVYATRKYKIIEDIFNHQDEFKNITWLMSNKLKSYICLPLTIKEKTVGTLSLFTGYRHFFYESDIRLLENISFLIATLTESSHIINELRTTQRELDKEKNKILSNVRAVGYGHSVNALLHDHKHELLTILKELELADESSPNKRLQIVRKQIHDIRKKIDHLMKEMDEEKAFSAVDINNVISSLVRVFKLEPKDSPDQIEFIESYSKDIPLLNLKEAEIKDVFYNLLSNAIKAINEARRKFGEIKIRTEVVKLDISYIQISIEDNGVGIRNEHRDKIYNKGFTTSEDGSGIGLFVTKSILSNYGGQIGFESTVGKGAKFVVRLPRTRYQV